MKTRIYAAPAVKGLRRSIVHIAYIVDDIPHVMIEMSAVGQSVYYKTIYLYTVHLAVCTLQLYLTDAKSTNRVNRRR